MKRMGFWAALALVVVINAVVLALVAYNRSGAPTSRMTLTQREMPLAGYNYGVGENTGLSLRIRWSRPTSLGRTDNPYPFLDRQKLIELGFDPTSLAVGGDWAHRKPIPTREAYVVLEYQGKGWQSLLQHRRELLEKGLEKAKSDAERKRVRHSFDYFVKHASRLVVIDAGRDPVALRARYPDRSRYLISKALIDVYPSYRHDGKQLRVKAIRAVISRLLPGTVNVPYDMRSDLERDKVGERRPAGHDYRVTLAYGRRYEPWIASVNK